MDRQAHQVGNDAEGDDDEVDTDAEGDDDEVDTDAEDDEDEDDTGGEGDEDDEHLAVSLHHGGQESLHGPFKALVLIMNVSEENVIF